MTYRRNFEKDFDFKSLHWLCVPKKQRGTFSMADIKTQYVNELLLDRLITIYGKDPSIEKNNPEIKKLYQLGALPLDS